MGANVTSRMWRPFKNWNVENRARKVISRDKPIPAPTFKSVEKQRQLVDQIDPNYKTNAMTKNEQLNDHLKQVYVSSNAEVSEIDSRYDPERPLPQIKTLPDRFEYGFYETEGIKEGKVSLRHTLTFLANHRREPEKYTVEFIANEYKLQPEQVANIIEHFKLFEVIKTEIGEFNQDVTARVPISYKSGVTIAHTEKKKKGKKLEELPHLPKVKQIGEK